MSAPSCTIWKFKLQPGQDICEVTMPLHSRILTAQAQPPDDWPYLWAMVDPSAPPVIRRFFIVGTGQPIDPKQALKYVGTVQREQGREVLHIFELVA